MKEWFYFGAHGGAGHFLWGEGMRRVYRHGDALVERLGRYFDGSLPPLETTPYRAAVTRIGGIGYSALSFWDYSVDRRGGSNSTFFAPGLSIPPEAFLQESQARFPQVFARLPQSLEIVA